MKIVPTPGRVVWFHPARGSSLFKELKNSATPLGALVAQVNDDETVNLCVASPRGDSVAVQNVPLIQADEPKPEFGSVNFARWMPYQIGQAAREHQSGNAIGKAVQTPEPAQPENQAKQTQS